MGVPRLVQVIKKSEMQTTRTLPSALVSLLGKTIKKRSVFKIIRLSYGWVCAAVNREKLGARRCAASRELAFLVGSVRLTGIVSLALVEPLEPKGNKVMQMLALPDIR